MYKREGEEREGEQRRRRGDERRENTKRANVDFRSWAPINGFGKIGIDNLQQKYESCLI
jgi:hypothetical protein